MRTSLFRQRPATPLTLSVVMAVYNEAKTVATAIERALAVDIPDVDVELVVVRDVVPDQDLVKSCSHEVSHCHELVARVALVQPRETRPTRDRSQDEVAHCG